jgi:hypothetical protein
MRNAQDLNAFTDLDRDEAIDGRVGVHDSNHVELKLDYKLGTTGKHSRYRVEAYFFVPAALGLNEQSYGRDHFYNDLQTYIRFKTPRIPLDALGRETDTSPLLHIVRLSDELRANPRRRELEHQLRYELRMFGCVARANLRDRVDSLSHRIDELSAGDSQQSILIGDICAIAQRFLEDLAKLVDTWRALRPVVLELPPRIRDTFQLVDEYLSLAIEIKLTALIRQLDRSPALNGEASWVRARSRELLLAERDYRAGAGYPSSHARSENDDDDDGEELIYRRSMLKKFVTSVLWLEIDKNKEGTAIADLGAGIAAGTAMLFAVLATILHMHVWMVNTAPFVIAAVVTYILKDRMKDWLKRFFSKRTSRFLADYSVGIRDPLTGAELGRSREVFRYLSLAKVPEKVLARRRKQTRSPGEIDAKPEIVFKYDKEIRLQNQEIRERLHLEEYDLNDISRFALWQLMVRADDPLCTLPVFDPNADRVKKQAFRKVYHLNVVMLFHAGAGPDATVDTRHLRVVFDKQAIRRLEEV